MNTMGTSPYKEKMPNRGMGREMSKDDDEQPQDVNVQEIATDPQFPAPGAGTKKRSGNKLYTCKRKQDCEGR